MRRVFKRELRVFARISTGSRGPGVTGHGAGVNAAAMPGAMGHGHGRELASAICAGRARRAPRAT